MGYTSSASTQTVSIDLKLTDLGRKKLIYGSGTNIKYFTLHDEGINYTSTVKPGRGSVPAVAGDKNSNTAIASGIGFKDIIIRKDDGQMGDEVQQVGVKQVKFAPPSNGWGSLRSLTSDTKTYNKLNIVVNLDYALNFMKWLSLKVTGNEEINYNLFSRIKGGDHPAASFMDGFLNFSEGIEIDTLDETTQVTIDTEKDDIDVCFLGDDDRINTRSTKKYNSDLQKYILMSREFLYNNGGSPINTTFNETNIDSPFKFAFSSGRENDLMVDSLEKLTTSPSAKSRTGKLYGGAGKWGVSINATDFVYGIRRRDWHSDGIDGKFDSGILDGTGQQKGKISYFDFVKYNDGEKAINSDFDFIECDPSYYEGTQLPVSTSNRTTTVPLYPGVSILTNKNKAFYPRVRKGTFPMAVPLLELCAFGSDMVGVQSDLVNAFFTKTYTNPYLFTNKGNGQILTLGNVGAADASRTLGTYTIRVGDYSTGASGANAIFIVTVTAGGAASVTLVQGGDSFIANETITVPDAELGGGGAASLTFDALTVNATEDYSTVLTLSAKPRNIKGTKANPVKEGVITVRFKYNKTIAEDTTIDWNLAGNWSTSYNYNSFIVKE